MPNDTVLDPQQRPAAPRPPQRAKPPQRARANARTVDRPWLSAGMAIGMHALLAAGLIFGLSWSSREPEVHMAELWAPLPSPEPVSLPPPAPPPPAEEPPAPPPKPVVAEPPKAAPKPARELAPEPPKVKPDIALAKEKEREDKLKKEKVEKERLEKERLEKERLEKEKIEKDKLEKKKLEQEKLDKAKREKELKEKEQKEKELKDKKEKELRARERQKELDKMQAEAALADKKTAKEWRDKELASMTGGSPQVGPASQGSQAGLADYTNQIRQKIKGNIVFDPSSANGNPEVVFSVEQFPNGEIMSLRKLKGSGNPAWDEAVERAIRKSEPLPRKKDGSVERSLELRFKPLDAR